MAVAVANVAMFIAILEADVLSVADFRQLMADVYNFLPSAGAVAVLSILNGLISADWKARLVFLRWTDALPGCHAFSVHAQSDPRVDVGALERMLGELPTDPQEQNKTWYRLYRSVISDSGVTHNHRNFLFARDYTSLAALFLIVLGSLAVYQIDNWNWALLYVGFLAVQFFVVRHAATRYGNRFVTTVLAVKAAEG